MVYCTHCGEKMAEDANFCPKCGTKTLKGKTAHAVYPTDQLTDAFYTVGSELERAFNIAARETHAALKKAREDLRQKPAPQPTAVCPKCNTKNPSGAIFCNNCGARMAPIEESHGGGA
ncbi:MAG TPA: zinc-ribbon domain-containing protein [Candidatus Acidoferrales bacterium]|nr:zinc-ribbon domain-containing protein [Candidatus Acidoferrales bacterium]